ncbi:MAG: hypothetical protein ACXWLM_09940, partial [Myxococcales bacterium]
MEASAAPARRETRTPRGGGESDIACDDLVDRPDPGQGGARSAAGARGLPTAVAVAATAPELAAEVARLLHADTLRAYVSTDIAGVEIGGAVKNVLAIAAGASDG